MSHSQFTLDTIGRALADERTAAATAPAGAPPLYVITNGVERPAVLAPPEAREPGLVVTTARMVEKKGLDTLVAAIGELVAAGRTDVRLEVIGEGPERDALELQIARLRLTDHVVLRGGQPPAEVQHTLQRAAIFALPAREARDGDTDGLPVAVLEAMAHGVPVVTTPIAGLPEAVLDGETGVLVPADDPVTLAAALARLLDDPELRDRLGTAGAGLVAERYDSTRSALELAEHFRRQR